MHSECICVYGQFFFISTWVTWLFYSKAGTNNLNNIYFSAKHLVLSKFSII